MKKTVIKTIITTLLSIILFLAILFTCLVCFSPKTLGKFFDNLGIESASLHYYESSFDKTKDYEALYFDVICKIDVKSDSKNSKKYIEEFTSCKDFEQLCSKIDNIYTTSTITTKEYVFGKLSASIFFLEGATNFTVKANEMISVIGYTKYNPYNYILANYFSDLSAEQKNQIGTAINGIYQTLSSGEKINADSDLALLN